MTFFWSIAGTVSFSLSALAYGVIGVLIAAAHPGSRQASWLLGAVIASFFWSVSLLYLIWFDTAAGTLIPIIDALYLATWVASIAAMIRGTTGEQAVTRLPRVLSAGAAAAVLIIVAVEVGLGGAGTEGGGSRISYALLLAIPLCGLLAIEQVYRNAEFRQRRVWLPLSLAVGAIFAVNVFVYSQAVLFGSLLASIWVLRGAVAALAAPAIVLAIKRHPHWETELFVSRHVVFYTTTLTGAGLYLIAMAIGGYLVGRADLVWGPVVQAVFLLSAAMVLLYAIFSAELRARLRVFIAKHFYRNRYDYREEWLRLIETLAAADPHGSPATRGVEALAAIIGSRRGAMWLSDSTGLKYEARAGWNGPRPEKDLTLDDPIVAFLQRSRWIVDTKEYAADPEKYANAFAAAGSLDEVPSIYVPLVHEGSLIGIVRLERPAALDSLGYEDHDLLKTAGQQVAVFMAQERSKEELSETRQLEAFSKLTTFLMHDLKNLIAQQELVVANAKKFGHRPEFVEDAMLTIAASVQRMRNVLARLQDSSSEQVSLIDLSRLVADVCRSCSDREPRPRLISAGVDPKVSVNKERLTMALTHAIRNAQDATDSAGSIELRLQELGRTAVIEVADTGVGMDADFVQNRLFKPFDSTKGAQGMGIGAYQLRETLRAADGDVEVHSEPGRGTTLRMTFPLAKESSAAESVA